MTINPKQIAALLALIFVAAAVAKAFGVTGIPIKAGIQNCCIIAATLAFVGERATND